MDTALDIKDRLDNLYNDVLNGKQEIFLELDQLIVEILKLKEIELPDDEIEPVNELMHSFIDKINLIYEILDVKKDNLLTLEHLKEEFHKLEMKRFVLENNYVMGMLKIEEINQFKDELFSFRNMLYAIPISDSNLLDIAKMKSKIQHFNTEILEDEDILRQAYENSN